MTQPVHTVHLAPPGYPMLTRMVSNPLFPEPKQAQVMACPHCKQNLSVPVTPAGKEEPITWIVGEKHPLVPDMKVIRMFLDHTGVEVYSVSSDNKAGMRNLVPIGSIRLVEEGMPLDVFAEELADAEEDEPEPGEPEPGEPEPSELEPPPAVPVSNGQTSP